MLGEGRFREAADCMLGVAGLWLAQSGGVGLSAVRDATQPHALLLASEDEVAVYAVLTAMASLSRAELKTGPMQTPAAKQLLECAPLAVREMLHDFTSARYAAALGALTQLEVSSSSNSALV